MLGVGDWPSVRKQCSRQSAHSVPVLRQHYVLHQRSLAVWLSHVSRQRQQINSRYVISTLTVLVATINAQWEGMGDVGSARYEPALLPPCPTIKVLSYSN